MTDSVDKHGVSARKVLMVQLWDRKGKHCVRPAQVYLTDTLTAGTLSFSLHGMLMWYLVSLLPFYCQLRHKEGLKVRVRNDGVEIQSQAV